RGRWLFEIDSGSGTSRTPRSRPHRVLVMQKNLTLTGSTLRGRTTTAKQRLRDAVEREVMPGVEGGQIKPLVGLTLPMQKADEAHRALDAGEVIGKVILMNE
ncbi:MAG: zinc-binding dehydrogenase, partial [Pseudomonadota bacterium]